MSQEFHREDRYIVIKHKDLGNVPVAYREHLMRPLFALQAHLPVRECVVVESDWPEYETVWQMIERRVTGQPAVAPAEELQAVLHWRDKHAQAINERDALQQRLNIADQHVSDLEVEVAKLRRGPCELIYGDDLPNQGIPGTSFQRLNALANEGE